MADAPSTDAPPGAGVAALRALQRTFLTLVTAREDVPGALRRLGWDAAVAEALTPGDARLDAVGRIDIYNSMYFFRLVGAVQDDFPTLAAVLGADDFRALMEDYLEAFPPREPSLRDLGRALPGYLGGHALTAARPWLVDLAALEWARADVFDSADAETLGHADLRALAPERFADLTLRAIPAARMIDLGHAVDDVYAAWRAQAEGVVVTPPAARPGLRLLVWRAGNAVRHRRAGAGEGEVLPALFEAPGDPAVTFGQICERLGAGREVDEAARLAFELLATWAEGGLLRLPEAG